MRARATNALRRAAPPKAKVPPGLDLDMLLANARDASDFLKALSHEVRLLILCFLIDGEKSVSEISNWRGCVPTVWSRRGATARTSTIRSPVPKSTT
jgi:hypothetical protein